MSGDPGPSNNTSTESIPDMLDATDVNDGNGNGGKAENDPLRSDSDPPSLPTTTPDSSRATTPSSTSTSSSSSSTPAGVRSLISNPRYAVPLDYLTCGTVASKYPPLMWLICCTIPLAYLVLMFGVIPIGERKDDDDEKHRFYHYWVFTCAVNPLNMAVIGFLNSGIFLSCMGVARPFRVHWSIVITVFVVTLVVWTVVLPFAGTFDFFGVASLFLCYFATLVGMSIALVTGFNTDIV